MLLLIEKLCMEVKAPGISSLKRCTAQTKRVTPKAVSLACVVFYFGDSCSRCKWVRGFTSLSVL